MSESPKSSPSTLVQTLARGTYEPIDERTLIGQDQWRVALSPRIMIGGKVYEVSVGFVTDFASLRWWMRGRLQPAGRHAVGAVFHDYFLKCTDLPKWQCDAVLYLLLREQGVPSLEASLMWLAVRTKPDSTRRS